MPSRSSGDALFDEWGRITRFLESARLPFARERNLWTSLEIATTDDVQSRSANETRRRAPHSNVYWDASDALHVDVESELESGSRPDAPSRKRNLR